MPRGVIVNVVTRHLPNRRLIRPGSEQHRLGYLDALRGIAAVWVALYHLSLAPINNMKVPYWAAQVVTSGGAGVILFFLVSAFSLQHTMPRHERTGSANRSFYLSRFFRIAPLFYVVLIVSVLRDTYHFHDHHSVLAYAASVGFFFNLVPNQQQGIVWASWTIGVEMLFYAAFPLLRARIGNVWDAVMWLAASAVAAAALSGVLDHYSAYGTSTSLARLAPIYLPVFIIGILTHFVRPSLDRVRAQRSVGGLLIAAGVLFFVELVNGRLSLLFLDADTTRATAFALILLGLSMRPTRFVVNRATRWLGKISFGVYLWHPLVLELLQRPLDSVYRWHVSNSVQFVVCAALLLVVLVPLASATYWLIERPGELLGKRVIARATANRAPVPAQQSGEFAGAPAPAAATTD